MDKYDALVLAVMHLPFEEQFEHMLEACRASPGVVTHPSIMWWASQNASKCSEAVNNSNSLYNKRKALRMGKKP